jgi:uncharacterized protein Yka (UPF0111/DUF47 family)
MMNTTLSSVLELDERKKNVLECIENIENLEEESDGDENGGKRGKQTTGNSKDDAIAID